MTITSQPLGEHALDRPQSDTTDTSDIIGTSDSADRTDGNDRTDNIDNSGTSRARINKSPLRSTTAAAAAAAAARMASSKLDRTATVKAKFEREVASLKEQIVSRDEQLLQLRSSLEMRKNEVKNLQTRLADVEKSCRAETERNGRHLKKIDDINLELKASETKLAAKIEENRACEKRAQKLRNDLMNAEEKLEQLSIINRRDMEVLHNKLSQARRRSSNSNTPTSPVGPTTPTGHDELMRLQMDIRDLKDALIDREAEVDYHKREMDLLKFKLETRTLEVDSNNQELARRCQDLLEQNRKSEDVLKELMRSSSEHSQQLIHATEELKEANGKCVKLREQIRKLESDLKEQHRHNDQLSTENGKQQQQLDALHKDIGCLKDQLAERETEADRYKRQIHELQETLDRRSADLDKDSQQYESRCQTLTEQNNRCEQIIEQLKRTSNEHSQQLERVIDDLKETNCKLRDKNNELENNLSRQLDHHAQLKKDNMQLRQTNDQWTQQLEAIHREMNTMQTMSPDERRDYESQVEFLNSVIVDMQKKNDDLQVQVTTMQVLGPM